MCGIAGVASSAGLRQTDLPLLDTMLAVLRHRGPDEQRRFADGHGAIGARRLSIIDLETGGQPIGNEDGTVQVSQNGEIYNYVELREELLRKGHTFRTSGDTEVIAHLYEDHGDAFVEHLRGMFAVAIWDAARRRLVLARDRLGKKPLYWRAEGGRILYGSELKSLLCDPSAKRTVDRVALARYLQYQYVPSPDTIIEDAHKLAPASILTWQDGEITISRYWQATYGPKLQLAPEEERARCLDLLRESVRLRLRSDVPLGLFLSGGLDSGMVLALMAEASPNPVRTFTIGFEDDRYDERDGARAVAHHFGATHTEEVVKLDALALLPRLAEHFDEPFGDSSALPTFRVAELASQDVRVVLTGDGGDEAFGGYARYRSQLALERLRPLPGPIRRNLIRGRSLARGVGGNRPRANAADTSLVELSDLPPDAQYVRLMSMSDLRLRSRLMGRDPVADQDAYLLAILADGPSDTVDRMLGADTNSYLPDDLLTKMDRATMAHSLEARAPLLDHRLVEFAGRLPTDRKIKGPDTKVLLREIARSVLPPGTVDRPKSGFGVPLAGWFRADLGDVYRDIVLSPDAMSRDHLDQGVAASLLEEHRSNAADHAHRLWLLLSFELWARRWLRQSMEAAA